MVCERKVEEEQVLGEGAENLCPMLALSVVPCLHMTSFSGPPSLLFPTLDGHKERLWLPCLAVGHKVLLVLQGFFLCPEGGILALKESRQSLLGLPIQ